MFIFLDYTEDHVGIVLFHPQVRQNIIGIHLFSGHSIVFAHLQHQQRTCAPDHCWGQTSH